MRKIIMFNRISMDNFFAGPRGETHEWFIPDPKVDQAAHEIMHVDTVLLGRVTYKLFEGFWPNVEKDKKATKEAKRASKELNQMTKLVFSKKLKDVKWKNSKLYRGNLEKEIKKIKKGKGADIVIFGSGTIVEQLTKAALIDEYLFVITPVILGEGKSFFDDVKKLDLQLLDTRKFKSGNVMLHYKAGKKGKKKNAK